ncbi:MAG: alpha-2-macroglobulin family protein [Polyangiaceae bacterium]
MGLGELSSNDAVVNVTDLGISAKMSRFGSLVWVTRLSTGEPVREATVNVYDGNGQVVSSKTTDPIGMASFSSSELRPVGKGGDIDSSLWLVARANDDFTFQRLVVANSRTGVGEVDLAQKGRWVGLVFTDRSVYRPGEMVKAGGFFRRTAEQGLMVRPGQAFEYSVRDSQGEVVGLGESKLDAYGALTADVNLGKSAAYGQATLTVRFGRDYDEQFSVPFEILAYKAAEFKVDVDAKRAEFVHRETAAFTIHSEYLYGAPVSEGRVQQYVTRQEVDFVPPNSTGFLVNDQAFLSDLRYYPNRGSTYSQRASVLDAKGEQYVELALDAPEQAKPENLTIEAEVVELSEQAQTGRTTVLVHPAQFYLGLKAPSSRFLAVGAPLPVEVAAIRPSGERVNGVSTKVSLFRRNWTSSLEDRPTDLLHHRTHIHDEPRGECQVTAGTPAVSCHLRLEEAGYYVLRASSVDAIGNPIHASLGVYAVSNKADEGASQVAFSNEDRRGLSLELDRPRYQPGDVAKVLVKSPFKEATALVTVERGGILERRVEKLRGPMPVIEIPIVDAYYPNAFVSVHLVRGRVAKMPAPGAADVGAPDYRIGYAQLLVDPEARRLRVQVTPSSKEFRPGDDVEAKVALVRPDGKPTKGTLTFYVVDEGVLRLTGYKTPNPLPAFAGPRPLGVFSVESRDYLAKILAYRDGERISPLGFEFKDSSNDKGDEVGGGDLPGRLRSDFRTTVYFESGRAVGDDGASTFRFHLPDNLTSFRLMAVAAGDGNRFGFGEEAITTFRRLMARPALPRMLRVGDRLEAGVVVSSKGLGQTDVEVTLNAKGVTLAGPKTLRVALKSQGQAEVRFPVVAAKEGEATFEFAVRGGGEADRVRVSRKIEQPIRFLSAATYGTTNESMSVGLGNLDGIRKDQGGLRVTLSNSALVGVRSVFEELANYPYGCTEQLTSRVLPLLVAPKLAALEDVKVSAIDRDAIDTLLGRNREAAEPRRQFRFLGGRRPAQSVAFRVRLARARARKSFGLLRSEAIAGSDGNVSDLCSRPGAFDAHALGRQVFERRRSRAAGHGERRFDERRVFRWCRASESGGTEAQGARGSRTRCRHPRAHRTARRIAAPQAAQFEGRHGAIIEDPAPSRHGQAAAPAAGARRAARRSDARRNQRSRRSSCGSGQSGALAAPRFSRAQYGQPARKHAAHRHQARACPEVGERAA